MKNLNTKGFAISTLLYGLMIMSFLIVLALISSLGTNRKNTKTLVEKIEDELNRYSLTTTSGNYEGGDIDSNGREYIAPSNGWYKIELWGASGGNSTASGGKGAYTSGTVYLDANDHLYFYVGQSAPTNRTAAFNGGGLGSTSNTNYQAGGGATDVRLVTGAWNDTSSLYSRIMVAAGGGGAGGSAEGGMGGTLVGGSGKKSNSNASSPSLALGGTQTSGGSRGSGTYSGSNGSRGSGGSGGTYLSGGGGGYYGGGASGYTSSVSASGAGGSSFIMGYAGVRTTNSSGNPTTNVSETFNIEYGEYDKEGNPEKTDVKKIVYNGLMVPGVNSGAGKFSVTKVSDNSQDNPPRKGSNNQLTDVRYIEDCVDSNTANGDAEWIEVQAISNGINVAKGKYVNISGAGGGNLALIVDGIMDNPDSRAKGATKNCISIDLKEKYNLDELAVWHQYKDNRSYRGHVIRVSTNQTTWTTIRAKSTETDTTGQENEAETANGIRYNSIQPDPTASLPDGNYYLFPASSDNQVLTYDAGDNDNAKLALFEADKKQIWKVEKGSNGYYRLIETSTGLALAITDGSGDANVNIDFGTNNSNNASQEWTITPLGNGYYKLRSKVGVYAGISGSNVITQSFSSAKTQRFKFVNAEY